jgi:microcystin-dependent protein
MLGLRNRDTLSGPILDEFENLVAQLRGFLLVSFQEDGNLKVTTPITNIVPTGSVLMWTTPTPPTGWLVCDGSAVERVTYKQLFDTIGTTYGPGDGVLTFNLPDMRGRFPLGKANAGTGSVLGGTGGTIDHTHTISGSTASATATISGATTSSGGGLNGTTSTDGSHSHTYSGTTDANNNSGNLSGGANPAALDGHTHTYSGTTASNGSHSHNLAGTAFMDNHSHTAGTLAVDGHTHGTGSLVTASANPPFQTFNFIIRT